MSFISFKYIKMGKLAENKIFITDENNNSVTVTADRNNNGQYTLTEEALIQIYKEAFQRGKVSGKTEFSNTLNELIDYTRKCRA